MPTTAANGMLMVPRKSEPASPMPVVSNLTIQKSRKTSGTFGAANTRSRDGARLPRVFIREEGLGIGVEHLGLSVRVDHDASASWSGGEPCECVRAQDKSCGGVDVGPGEVIGHDGHGGEVV